MTKLKIVFPLAAIAFILLVFYEYLPFVNKPLSAEPKRRRWTATDSMLCLFITSVYAFTAFLSLGDETGIESFCKFRDRGEYALFELYESTDIGEVRYYPGLHMGNYHLQFSSDGEEYTTASVMKQGHADLFKWKTAELEAGSGSNVRYIRIIADSKLWLGEIAFYDADNERIAPETMLVPDGCRTLVDEQSKIPDVMTYQNSTYFDEIYHARTAYEHMLDESPYEISHPPLGKLIISLGIRLFGMVPFGWRFSGTVFGVLMLPALYIFLKKMFGGSLVPACGTALMASDFMHYVQTRIATIDTYAVFFTLLMYLFFWLYWQSDREGNAWKLPLALSGVCFGLGAASKWTCIYAGAGLGVLWLIDRISRARAMRRAGTWPAYLKETRGNILWCLLFFVAVPCCIYYLSYWNYGTAEGMHGLKMLFSPKYAKIVFENQKYMFSYHSGVTATHPYSSVWWQWLLNIRPILYYSQTLADGSRSTFGAWLNPILCWAGLLAVFAMAFRALFFKDRTALFILIGYLAQLVPWLFVSRVVFEYHYFPCTVFLILALGHVLSTIEHYHPTPKTVIGTFTGTAVVLFAVFYPALSGLPVSRWYSTNFIKWLGSWPF